MANRKEENAMEQDNKTMSAKELIRYIEDNNLELQMLDILLFNDCGFEFVPLYKPRIKPMIDMDETGVTRYSIVGDDDRNVLNSDYQVSVFEMPDEIRPKKWNKFINHPEHLHAYMSRFDDWFKCEVIYSRSSSFSEQIRNEAFEDFVECSGISNIKEFNALAQKATKNRNEYGRHILTRNKGNKKVDMDNMNFEHIFFDERVFNSIIHNHEDLDEITRIYLERLICAEQDIYLERYVYVGLMICQTTECSVSFIEKFVPPTDITTSLGKDLTIIDKYDQIPNILYQIAIKIGANVFFAATGYAYDSGILMLEPVTICTKAHASGKEHTTELVVGDLQNYRPEEKQRSMNRKTAERINWMLDSHELDNLYTYPDSFYHGKFYYISNGRITYVIVGSSNITESAYTKNRELDVMFRFERGEDGQPCEREQMFLDWYADLKEKCVEIPRLDETLFSSNLLIDEAGNSSSSSILKKLTSEEERERYRFLESLCPSSVDEKMFYKKKEFKAFRGYIAFFYPENNITVLESFQYGNSCFVFGTTDEERIRMALMRKSKEQVKQSDIYISNVNHDEDYQSELHQIFGK